MKELTARQSILIMVISVLATKFFILPTQLIEIMKQDVVMIMLAYLAVEILLIAIITKVAVKHPDLTFYELLEKSFGKIYAKLIFLLLFGFFIAKNLLVMNETFAFFLNTLYDELNALVYIVPSVIIFFFAYIKGLKCIGRTIELIWIFIIIGLLLTILLATPNVDITNLLPLFDVPLENSLQNLQENIFWFGDFFIFLIFFGKIDYNKKYTKKMVIAMFCVLAIIVLFLGVYFCLFPYSTGVQHFAVSDITQFSPRLSNFGRIDWLTSFVWTLASLMQAIIYFYCTCETLKYILGTSNKVVICSISLVILLIFATMLGGNLTITLSLAQSPFRFIVLVLIVAGFLLTPIHSYIITRRTKNEK